MHCLSTLLNCLTGNDAVAYERLETLRDEKTAIIMEQPALKRDFKNSYGNNDDELRSADSFVEMLRTLECDLEAHDPRSDDNYTSKKSWSELAAEHILAGIKKLVKNSEKMGKTMKQALGKAVSAAVGFAKDHPVFVTVIALGMLVLLAPWVLEVLGFAEEGPVLGSFAARWMSSIARSQGGVSKGSLYAFLQRLGMTWA